MSDNVSYILKLIVVFAVGGPAIWWAQRADRRRRTRRLSEAANALGLELSREQSDAAPMEYPTRGQYRNVFYGQWRGEDIIVFDEIIEGTKSSDTHTVVGFKKPMNRGTGLLDYFRLWQINEYGGWTWVYRRFGAASPKKLESYIEKCHEKAFTS